jgi:hypothetical protein
MNFFRSLRARLSSKLDAGYQDHIQVWASDLKKTIANSELEDLKKKYQDVPTTKGGKTQLGKKNR